MICSRTVWLYIQMSAVFVMGADLGYSCLGREGSSESTRFPSVNKIRQSIFQYRGTVTNSNTHVMLFQSCYIHQDAICENPWILRPDIIVCSISFAWSAGRTTCVLLRFVQIPPIYICNFLPPRSCNRQNSNITNWHN